MMKHSEEFKQEAVRIALTSSADHRLPKAEFDELDKNGRLELNVI